MAPPLYSDSERLRRIYQILVLFYQEHRSQADIAKHMGISPATVNRMIREGHERGLVEIKLHAPFGMEAELKTQLKQLGNLDSAVAVHAPSSDPAIVLKAVAEAAATALLEHLSDGMTIAISGGEGLCALIEAISPKRKYDVRVVPATGGVQGRFRTDVNHVAVELAEKLGGEAFQLYAPLFATSEEERAALMRAEANRSVLEMAKKADVAVFGIGSVEEEDSTYLSLTDAIGREALALARPRGEVLAHLVTETGELCDHPTNRRLVALTLEELAGIPHRIAIASGSKKVSPIAAVLSGGLASSVITDEHTATAVVAMMKGRNDADEA